MSSELLCSNHFTKASPLITDALETKTSTYETLGTFDTENITPAIYKTFNFSTILPTFLIVHLFDSSHPNVFEMISYCSLDLNFCNDLTYTFSHVY